MNTQVTQFNDIAKIFPQRANTRDANKGTYGHVFVIAGSKEVAGAPILAAEGATRAGAGLVTLVVPESISAIVMAKVSSVVMTRAWSDDSINAVLSIIEKADVIVLGPGIGVSDETISLTKKLLEKTSCPVVLDADALTLMSKESDRGESLLRDRHGFTILTPHPGEMARLLGMKNHEVQEDRYAAVTRAAKFYQCTVVLKGSRTLIATKDGAVYENPTGNPGMATGGSGDVLSGVIAALLGQGLKPLDASIASTYIHGLAGDLAAKAFGGFTGLIATDLIMHLPKAIAHCQNNTRNDLLTI